ncbi:hypothetical protein F4604DRAFT_1674313 [Suillus subluteus]|nr:hypothetical protein F4604DRAFT_1674313 [Suillus subluteus]
MRQVPVVPALGQSSAQSSFASRIRVAVLRLVVPSCLPHIAQLCKLQSTTDASYVRTCVGRMEADERAGCGHSRADCLLDYETVKYFSGEEYEAQRCTKAIWEYQSLEKRAVLSLNLLNLVQTFTITSGLLVCSLIVASCITRGQSDASDSVVFITYYAQTTYPSPTTTKLLHCTTSPSKSPAVDALPSSAKADQEKHWRLLESRGGVDGGLDGADGVAGACMFMGIPFTGLPVRILLDEAGRVGKVRVPDKSAEAVPVPPV